MQKSLLIIFLFLQVFDSCSQKNEGVIVRIIDGDTFEIFSEEKKIKVRLYGIDCPEDDQPYGAEATEFVTQFLNRTITYKNYDFDRYGRMIADVYVNDTLINALLVENGLAWHYKKYSDDVMLAQKEENARAERTGLWKEEDAVAPWNWRSISRTQNVKFTTTTQTSAPDFSKTESSTNENTVFTCGNSKRGVYHRSSNCSGLKNCKSRILQRKSDDIKKLENQACEICFKK